MIRIARPRGISGRDVTVLAASVALMGCGSGEQPSPYTVYRDSSGVTIVENDLADRSDLQPWSLSADPILEIGAAQADPSHEFNVVAGALRLSDGRIVVADQGSRELRFFSPGGAHLLTVGGEGGGPGEFARLASVDLLHGDTIAASDWPIGTISWFDSAGTYFGKTRIGPYWPGLAGHTLRDGSLLVDVYDRMSYGNELEYWAAYGSEREFRPSGILLRVSRQGEHVDTIRSIVGEEWYKVGEFRQGLTIHAMPFARTTKVGWSANRIYVGETGGSEIEVYRFDGTLERLVRWQGELETVGAVDRDQFSESVLTTLRRPNRRPDYERWLAAVPYPGVKPAFKELIAEPTGDFWVQRWPSARDRTDEWLVFAADGQMIAVVETPEGLTLLDVGEDYVIALWRDELDLEYVRLYGLSRG